MSNTLHNPFEGISELFHQRDSIIDDAADLFAEIHLQKRADLIGQLRSVESDGQTTPEAETVVSSTNAVNTQSTNVEANATEQPKDNVVSLDEFRANAERESVSSKDTASHIERLTGTG